MFFFKFICMLSKIVLVFTWDLTNYGITESYYVSSLALYRHRAFVSLPRSSCLNNVTNPTLIELPWFWQKEDAPVKRKTWLFREDSQIWGNCKKIQDAISVAVEARRGRLWILDKGSDECSTKIVIYNLHTNHEIISAKLKGFLKNDLVTLVLDTHDNEFGTRAYLGGMKGKIVVFSVNELKWWTVKLADKFSNSVLTEQVALSRMEPILFFTGSDSENLFSLNLRDIRSSSGPLAAVASETVIEKNVTLHGQKLGPSGAITCDSKAGLIYYLTRDFAVVRWNTRKALKAEHHDVLGQSYKYLPYVSSFVVGPQSIWALTNPVGPEYCKNDAEETLPELPMRLVKIITYA